jgi:hypothetical protein
MYHRVLCPFACILKPLETCKLARSGQKYMRLMDVKIDSQRGVRVALDATGSGNNNVAFETVPTGQAPVAPYGTQNTDL